MNAKQIEDNISKLQRKKDRLELQSKEVKRQLSEARKEKSSDKEAARREAEILRHDRAHVKRLIALFERANGSTYEHIGEMLGFSGNRARDIIGRMGYRFGWFEKSELETLDNNYRKIQDLASVRQSMLDFMESRQSEGKITGSPDEDGCKLFMDGKEILYMSWKPENLPLSSVDKLQPEVQRVIANAVLDARLDEQHEAERIQDKLNNLGAIEQ